MQPDRSLAPTGFPLLRIVPRLAAQTDQTGTQESATPPGEGTDAAQPAAHVRGDHPRAHRARDKAALRTHARRE